MKVYTIISLITTWCLCALHSASEISIDMPHLKVESDIASPYASRRVQSNPSITTTFTSRQGLYNVQNCSSWQTNNIKTELEKAITIQLYNFLEYDLTVSLYDVTCSSVETLITYNTTFTNPSTSPYDAADVYNNMITTLDNAISQGNMTVLLRLLATNDEITPLLSTVFSLRFEVPKDTSVFPSITYAPSFEPTSEPTQKGTTFVIKNGNNNNDETVNVNIKQQVGNIQDCNNYRTNGIQDLFATSMEILLFEYPVDINVNNILCTDTDTITRKLTFEEQQVTSSYAIIDYNIEYTIDTSSINHINYYDNVISVIQNSIIQGNMTLLIRLMAINQKVTAMTQVEVLPLFTHPTSTILFPSQIASSTSSPTIEQTSTTNTTKVKKSLLDIKIIIGIAVGSLFIFALIGLIAHFVFTTIIIIPKDYEAARLHLTSNMYESTGTVSPTSSQQNSPRSPYDTYTNTTTSSLSPTHINEAPYYERASIIRARTGRLYRPTIWNQRFQYIDNPSATNTARDTLTDRSYYDYDHRITDLRQSMTYYHNTLQHL